jgi:hypothetical protein
MGAWLTCPVLEVHVLQLVDPFCLSPNTDSQYRVPRAGTLASASPEYSRMRRPDHDQSIKDKYVQQM